MKNLILSLGLIFTLPAWAQIAVVVATPAPEIPREKVSVTLKVDSIQEFPHLNQAFIENPRLVLDKPFMGVTEVEIYDGPHDEINVCILLGYPFTPKVYSSSKPKKNLKGPIAMVWDKGYLRHDAMSILTYEMAGATTVIKTLVCEIKKANIGE